ncbi:peptidoglycan -binding protein [Kaustia mangrovi]|uniref:Peptidoglycan -binding protein n=1 Tax=Kaustia mangrovi TaxID=2593653 RepID=A0A7S8C666_9HYPH|nr:peptidoglycan -binding protein [Kaustia mangrovi]QPC43924.1 peptidoglycan -binding protein [Kaustia mangrovi]
MALSARRPRREQSHFWPGFVDAISTLLLVFVFLLSVFVVAQFLLAREISGQDTVLNRLRSEIAELTEMLALEKSAKVELESTLAALTDDLESSRDRNARLQDLLDEETQAGDRAGATIAELRSDLTEERKVSAEALARVELLNQQIAALRRQISILNAALDAAEERDRSSKAQIADLGRRLNVALAQRVQELARYRSEFFGRLRQILGQRADIQVVGDRFVFQAEVLFPKGEATINAAGRSELDKLADALKQLEGEIPADLNWVLRVDGHTDTDPIRTAPFPSNWELSTARATAVVKYLIGQGVSPQHLVAAGFGEYHPITAGDTEAAKRRNRRIELKLTEG